MKKLLVLLALVSYSIHSISRPLSKGEEKVAITMPKKEINNDNNVYGDVRPFDFVESVKDNPQNGRNSKSTKRGKHSKKESRTKSTKKETKKNTDRRTSRKVVPRNKPQKTDSKRNNSSDWGLGLMADVIGGYSNFMWKDGTPKAGVGFGAGVTGLFHLNETDYAPEGYFAELGLNYIRKGSAAYPIDYVNAKLLPLSYSFNHLFGDLSLFVKAGGYIAYPFSKIKTKTNSFDTKLDYGAIGSVGVSYERFSLSASYEHGFADVSKAKVSLNNQNVFLTLSYRIF